MIKVVQHVLLDKQLELIPVRTVCQDKLVQVKQIWNAKIVKLDIIKTKKVFLLVSNVFQADTKTRKARPRVSNVELANMIKEDGQQEMCRRCAKTVSTIVSSYITYLPSTHFTHL